MQVLPGGHSGRDLLARDRFWGAIQFYKLQA